VQGINDDIWFYRRYDETTVPDTFSVAGRQAMIHYVGYISFCKVGGRDHAAVNACTVIIERVKQVGARPDGGRCR